MTKEENIATLNEHLTHWKRLLSEKICDQDEGEKTIDALQNAIKALEQESTDAVDRVTIKEYLESFGNVKTEQEPCEDCVSRSAVLAIAGDSCLDLDSYEDTREFCDEINDLPSVTPHHCEDAISRQEVLDVISELNAISFYEAQEDSKECYYEIRNAIKQLPSVTPQPKMGQWIKDKCSICGEERAWYGQNPPYCPDCGSYNGGAE